MPQISRSEIAVYAACAVLIAVLGWRALPHGASAGASDAPRPSTPRITSTPTSRSALVHVVGAVRRPGVYRLAVGERVKDAIRRAGGTTAPADTQGINLAAKLTDAQQVVVPRKSPAPGASPAGPLAAGAGAAASPGAAGAARTPVSLNSATAEQLDTLDGVGPTTAQKILEYRAQHGGFRSVDDLGQIPGIGPKRLESLRAQVQL